MHLFVSWNRSSKQKWNVHPLENLLWHYVVKEFTGLVYFLEGCKTFRLTKALLWRNKSLCLFVSLATYQMRSHTLVYSHENTQSSLEARWRPGLHVRRTGSTQKPWKLSSCSSSCSSMLLCQQRHLPVSLMLFIRAKISKLQLQSISQE